MIDHAVDWLRKSWWGLAVAYGIVLVASYLTIWQLAEPIGIPDTMDTVPGWVKTRFFFHVVAAVVIGAHATLILDILIRRSDESRQSTSLLVARERFQHLNKALRHLVQVQADFRVRQWSLTYRVNKNGDDLLHEELAVSPLKESVYLYSKGYGVEFNDSEREPRLRATNDGDGAPLRSLEIDRSDKKTRFAIVLDPPATPEEPRKIRIECSRSKLWSDLLEHDEDSGALTVRRRSDLIRLEFVAPPGREWQTLRRAVREGEVRREFKGGESRLIWELRDVSPRQYSYQVFLKPAPKS